LRIELNEKDKEIEKQKDYFRDQVKDYQIKFDRKDKEIRKNIKKFRFLQWNWIFFKNYGFSLKIKNYGLFYLKTPLP